MENYTFKEADIEDLEEVSALIWEVFFEFEGSEYSDEGIANFKAGLNYETMKDRLLMSGQKMWICCDKDRIIGVIRARPPCHINLLFVKKEYHKKGIARTLFNKMNEYYKTICSNTKITVNSSPYAIEIYRKLGFVETNSEQIKDGIRFTPMKRPL